MIDFQKIEREILHLQYEECDEKCEHPCPLQIEAAENAAQSMRLLLDVARAADAFRDKNNKRPWPILSEKLAQALTALREHCDD